MRWYHYVAYFFGGIFLANALPHLGNGISGHAFQSPFASPPGVGLSSSVVNVVWGLFNLALHAWDQPVRRMLEVADEKGIQLWLPEPGAPTEVVAGTDLRSRWWEQAK